MVKQGIYVLEEGFNTQKKSSFTYPIAEDCNPTEYYGLEANIKVEQPIELTVRIGESSLKLTVHGGGYRRVLLPTGLFCPPVTAHTGGMVCFECDRPFGVEEVHFKRGKSIYVYRSEASKLVIVNCETYLQNVDFYGEGAPESIVLAPYETRVLSVINPGYAWTAVPNGQGANSELIPAMLTESNPGDQ